MKHDPGHRGREARIEIESCVSSSLNRKELSNACSVFRMSQPTPTVVVKMFDLLKEMSTTKACGYQGFLLRTGKNARRSRFRIFADRKAIAKYTRLIEKIGR